MEAVETVETIETVETVETVGQRRVVRCCPEVRVVRRAAQPGVAGPLGRRGGGGDARDAPPPRGRSSGCEMPEVVSGTHLPGARPKVQTTRAWEMPEFGIEASSSK